MGLTTLPTSTVGQPLNLHCFFQSIIRELVAIVDTVTSVLNTLSRIDVSFDAVHGNWTCSLSNSLGTDVARLGQKKTECGTTITVFIEVWYSVLVKCIGWVLSSSLIKLIPIPETFYRRH